MKIERARLRDTPALAWTAARAFAAESAKAGIRRISTGSAIARATHKKLVDVTTAMLDEGDFSPLLEAASGKAIDYMLQAGGNDG